MLGLGATARMAFDSGGSATLVARELGDAGTRVLNDPSDGRERPVADGLFAYSTAPAGADPHLVVRPASFIAYRGRSVALQRRDRRRRGPSAGGGDVAPIVPTRHRARTLPSFANPADRRLRPRAVRHRRPGCGAAIVPDRPNPRARRAITLPCAPPTNAASRSRSARARYVGPPAQRTLPVRAFSTTRSAATRSLPPRSARRRHRRRCASAITPSACPRSPKRR